MTLIYSKPHIQGFKCRAITKKVIGSYIRLKKIGKRSGNIGYVGICPFHHYGGHSPKDQEFFEEGPFDDPGDPPQRIPEERKIPRPENTPSFKLFCLKKDGMGNETWLYKCFGCGCSGDVFNFVMNKEGVTFLKSVQIVKEIMRKKRQKFPPRNKPYYLYFLGFLNKKTFPIE